MAHSHAPLLRCLPAWLLALACALPAPAARAQGAGSAPAAGAKPAEPAKPAATPATSAATPAPAAAPAAKKTFVVKVPPGGRYVISIPEAAAAPVQAAGDQATLEVPANLPKFTLSVVDDQSGYAARRELEAASVPAEVALTPADMKLVHLVRLKITGQGDKPVANGVVVLTDALNKVHQFQISPAQAGEIQISDVAQGKAQVMVQPLAPATATTKEVQVTLQKGETSQTIPIGLPEVTDVVNTPAAATPTPTATATPAPSPAPVAPAPPAPAPPADSGGGAGSFFQNLLGFIILGGLGYGLYAYGKKQGWTVESFMEKLGVQPQATVVGTPGPGPAPAPPPPPVVADPNRCSFCGEMKDLATGACACTIGAGAAAPFGAGSAAAAPFGAAGSAGPAQPRLIAASGLYGGEIFPIHGEAVIGRDPMNAIPLDRDTTVSRRHARIFQDAGGFRIVDEGSSNGTFVNGAKVTETALRSGDEVSIGGTRFRFEA